MKFNNTLILFSFFVIQSCATKPPRETSNFKSTNLKELVLLDSTIKLDIRYATSNNFVGQPVYDEARAFLQNDAAIALIKIHQAFKQQGLGLIIFDAYRPWSVTKLFWDITPKTKREFVANPKDGSKHNRGCAVDLSLYDLKTGLEIEMPSAYDDFSEKAHPNYNGGTIEQRKMRDLLKEMMISNDFLGDTNEWWHFDYKDWKNYKIENISFKEIR
jgi:D-alanyl-D-alanine dipeptidase